MEEAIASDSIFKQPAIATATCLPSPREAVGRGRGWGVPQQTRRQRSKPKDPPPPTSRASFARLGPRHAQGRVEGGERTVHDFAISPHVFCARYYFVSRPLQTEGAGNAGRPMRPIAACAMVVVERTRVSQVTPESPGIPHAMVYGLFRALPGARALWPPSPVELPPRT